ncbi:hypothetical protein [Fimbriiglobus ruber]|uniref:hypothetical protein n=1 Tax=Fimbriiglobus ruber TaxID=1908690 RepID=UPI000B4A87B6|nr:hypothetical protein [Fimbriiglobus ruber]
MPDDVPQFKTSLGYEILAFTVYLSLIFLFIVACALASVSASILVSPWLGVVVSIGSFWVWAKLGPPPMPGFLNGLLCIWGFAALSATFLFCVALVLRRLFV